MYVIFRTYHLVIFKTVNFLFISPTCLVVDYKCLIYTIIKFKNCKRVLMLNIVL